MFAKLIASHPTAGHGNWLMGPRVFTNAQVSLPTVADGNTGPVTQICAKAAVTPASLLANGNVDLHADVQEGPNGVRMSMARHAELGRQVCKGPFFPFPELEALSRPR